ncbi:hypothetical protein TL16_g04976 [Triparma laevis f. inornata]|uniref:Uncharacterized protein n=1 Tax=Triparma laevis f. inornata TaxID=1714386 RepID=A0A9W7AAR5_9STRA|nr:hypothetical protein TL16_g04976 [Triparma laevis f. inornata]
MGWSWYTEFGVIFRAEISVPENFSVREMIRKLNAFPTTTLARLHFNRLGQSEVLNSDVVGVIFTYLEPVAVMTPQSHVEDFQLDDNDIFQCECHGFGSLFNEPNNDSTIEDFYEVAIHILGYDDHGLVLQYINVMMDGIDHEKLFISHEPSSLGDEAMYEHGGRAYVNCNFGIERTEIPARPRGVKNKINLVIDALSMKLCSSIAFHFISNTHGG